MRLFRYGRHKDSNFSRGSKADVKRSNDVDQQLGFMERKKDGSRHRVRYPRIRHADFLVIGERSISLAFIKSLKGAHLKKSGISLSDVDELEARPDEHDLKHLDEMAPRNRESCAAFEKRRSKAQEAYGELVFSQSSLGCSEAQLDNVDLIATS
jgi:hypothetical protein